MTTWQNHAVAPAGLAATPLHATLLPIGTALALARRWLHRIEGIGGPLLELAIRIGIGQMFLVSGLIKATNFDTALLLATNEYPVDWLAPEIAARLGLAIELICPPLLIAGLFTRLAALPLIALSLVIEFNYLDLPDHLFWAILLGWIAVRGPGALSLDRLLDRGAADLPIPGAGLYRRLLALSDRYLAPLYQVFLRFWMAAIFWAAGQTKFANFDLTVTLFAEEYKVPVLPPEIAAGLATATELSMPVLLLIGFCTRLATLPLMAMTLVIQFTYLDRAEHFLWLATLGLIALRGPGPIALDRLVLAGLRRVFLLLDGLSAAHLVGAPNVVIVGAGFGGIAAAKALAHTPARVTVVDRRNYHLFQPLLYQVATASLSPADIAQPIREILREQVNAHVLLGRVDGVDTLNQEVRIDDRRLPYDYLILATGARHSYFGHDGWEGDAPGLKKIDDATAIRRRILSAFEHAEAEDNHDTRSALLTFVVVGGGPTGVELAGAIAELARLGMEKDFRSFDPATARVLLLEAGPRVLAAFSETLSMAAAQSLRDLGVDVQTGARVERIDDHGVVVNGNFLPARTVIWAAGVAASPAAHWLGAKADRAGRILVNPDLSVPGLPNVYAIGDTAAASTASGAPVPGLAPAAKQGGAHVARAIRARIAGGDGSAPFRYRHLGSLATIGRKAAVADFGRLRLTGMVAWWFWGAVHVAFLVGARSRVSVVVQWAWAYLTFRRSIRLITGQED